MSNVIKINEDDILELNGEKFKILKQEESHIIRDGVTYHSVGYYLVVTLPC